MKKNILFLENFSQLLAQGYTVEQSLTISNQIFHLPFYSSYINALSQGEDIYDLLLKGDYPLVFKNYLSFYRNKAYLSEAIDKSLKIYKKQNDFINKLKKQLSYPLMLILFLFGFSLFVLVFLLPQVNSLFESFSIEMNVMTVFMLSVFRLFPFIFLFLCVSFMILSLIFIYGIKMKKHKILDSFMTISLFRLIIQKYFSLKFALFYNELSLDNIDTSSIIELLNEQMCDNDIKIILYEMKKYMDKGVHIEDVLVKIKYFDALLVSFFHIHFSNHLKKDAISLYIETAYQTIDIFIEKFIKIVIPVVYCFVSFFVVGIYVAIIIPLMSGFTNI